MKTFAILCAAAFLSLGSVLAETQNRFEVSAESGFPSIISGPDVKDISNAVGRFGFATNKEFQLTLTYAEWDGVLARDDSLGIDFSKEVNKERASDSQINFRDSRLDDRDISFRQIEFGVVKSIPIAGKHWESYIGLGLGVQRTEGTFSWRRCRQFQPPPNERFCADGGFIPPVNDPEVKPEIEETKNNEFLTTVRGGVRYAFVDWFALQANLRWIPIAKMLDRNYNGLEVNGGIVFRFGKF